MEKSASEFVNLKYISDKSRELLDNKIFWKGLEKNINIGDAGIIVIKSDKLLYSSKILSANDIVNDLPKYGAVDEEKRSRPIIDNYLLIAQLAISICIALFIVFICTDVFLTYHVSQSITKPIEELKNAANKIKEGNLDFEIKYI